MKAYLNVRVIFCLIGFTLFTASAIKDISTNVKIDIHMSELTANVTWERPPGYDVGNSVIKVFNSEGHSLLSNYVKPLTSLHYLLPIKLQRCMEYSVQFDFSIGNNDWLRTPKYKFVMSAPLEGPRNIYIRMDQSGVAANVSWKPATDKYVKYTYLELALTNTSNLPIYTQKITGSVSHHLVSQTLRRCEEYVLQLKFCYSEVQCSNAAKSLLVTSDMQYTSMIGSDIAVEWSTQSKTPYNVKSPSGTVIYEVSPSGRVTPGSDLNKYSFGQNVSSSINVTVRQVNESDAGLYTSVYKFSNGTPEACAFLTVTDIPETPLLSVQPEMVFVGDTITFTCKSSVRRWPKNFSSSLTYTYKGISSNSNSDTGTLIVKDLQQESQKGLNVTCTATDDLKLKSNPSNTITIHPFYGPDTIDINPNVQTVDIMEGETLGPYNCTSECNPPCNIKWSIDITDAKNMLPKSSSMNIRNISRSQSGTYTCAAVHAHDKIRSKTKSVVVKVLHGPDKVIIQPYQKRIDIYEGGTLGPYICKAQCNPECQMEWSTNATGHFVTVFTRSELKLTNIQRTQSGTYRCEAKYNPDNSKSLYKDMTVNVGYGPDTIHIHPNIPSVDIMEGDTLGPYDCTSECNPPCNITWSKDITDGNNMLPRSSSLSITNISRSQSGTYTCTAVHKHKRSKTKSVVVNVQHGPDKVIIQPYQKRIDIYEGGTLGPYICKAQCNPECQMEWSTNATGHFVTVFTMSELKLANIQRTQSGTYRCEAKYNPDNSKSLYKDMMVHVEYGPDTIDIDPNLQTVDIMEGDTLGPYDCTSECNPPCNITWSEDITDDNNMLPRSSSLSITNISRRQSGTYTCVAVHKHDKGRSKTKSVVVNVQHGPDQVIIQSYETTINIYEGDNLGPYTCTAKCIPSCKMEWSTNVTTRFVTVTPWSELNITSIQRTQSGTYRCEAKYNPDNSKSLYKDMMVNVEYGPDEVNIEPYSEEVNITEGDTLGPFECSAECNPSCDVKWRVKDIRSEKFKTVISTSLLEIYNIHRYQSGTYRCRVLHEARDNKRRRDIIVNVQYPPTITDVILNGEMFSNGSKFTLTEYKPLETVVKMESNPEAFLSFYKEETNLSTVNPERNNGSYNFTVSDLRCEDSGVYFIEASNNVKNNSVRTVVLNVECEPKSIALDKNEIGTVKGTIINFTLSVVANPKPTIAWKPAINHTWEVTEVGTNQHRGFSRLEILDEESFGIYNVEICGKAKCVVENITVKAEGKPDAPWNLTVIEVSHSWINVSFIAGFDGGLDQSFSVQCRSADDREGYLIDRVIEAADRSKNTKIYHRVEGLIPNTKYNFTLTAKNSLGSTSIDMDFTTNKAPVSKSASMTVPVGVVGAGSGIGVAVLAVALVSIIVFRRRKMIAKENNAPSHAELRDLHLPEAIAGGCEYASVSKVKKNETHGIELNNEYAEVSKPKTRPVTQGEMNNEYAEVYKVNTSSRKGHGLTQNEATDESLYANRDVTEKSRPHYSKNADGLIYIEVEFTKPPSSLNGRPVIHGDDDRTDYVDIDFTRRADPLPDSDPEDNNDSGQ